MKIFLFLAIILILGFAAHSRLLIMSCVILFVLKIFDCRNGLDFLVNRGVETGLLFLLLAIISPLIIDKTDWSSFNSFVLSPRGVIAIISGLLATRFNEMGLNLLESCPQLVVSIVIGSLLGITIFGGIPVGPLMAAGIAAIIFHFMNWLGF